MDTATASIIVAAIMGAASIGVAIVTGRTSAERLARDDQIRRLKRRLVETHGEDSGDVDQL